MNRKTLIALAVLGILIVVAVVVTRQPEKGQVTGERPRPVPKLAAGSFDLSPYVGEPGVAVEQELAALGGEFREDDEPRHVLLRHRSR